MEIIFVIGLVIIGLLGILAVVISNLIGSDVSKTMIVASNLAREGVEVVRQIRDSNWLNCNLSACSNWDEGLGKEDGETDSTAIAVFNNNTWTLKYKPKKISDSETQIYFNPTQTGIYKQDVTPPDGFKETLYRRLLTLNEICSEDDGGEIILDNDEICEAQLKIKIGIRVKSQVNWVERGQHLSLVAEDRIYNWR